MEPIDFDALGAPATEDGPVRPGVFCIRCTYALDGLATDAACPECGTPVAETLRQNLISGADLGYLKRIRGGLSVLLNGICLWFVVVVGLMAGNMAMQIGMMPTGSGGGFSFPAWYFPAQVAGSVLTLGALLIVLWGYWRFSERDPGLVFDEFGRRADPASRLVLRWATGVHAGAAVLSTAAGIVSLLWTSQMFSQMSQGQGAPAIPPMGPLFWISTILGWLSGLAVYAAFGTAFFSSMFYARALALRIPDMTIHAKAKSRMIACPIWATVGVLLIGIGPLIALVLYYNLFHKLRKRLSQIIEARERAG